MTSDDDNADSARTSAGLGATDETHLLPPAAQASPAQAWSNEEPRPSRCGSLGASRGAAPRCLARRLSPYGITSTNIRGDDGQVRKGYYRADFMDAWARYLPDGGNPPDPASTSSPDSSATTATDVTPQVSVLFSVADIADTTATDGEGDDAEAVRLVADILGATSVPSPTKATDGQNTAYIDGMCMDCRTEPHSAGRPRCDTCHSGWLTAIDGHGR